MTALTTVTDSWTQAYMEYTLDMHRHKRFLTYEFCWTNHPLMGRVVVDFGFLLGESA